MGHDIDRQTNLLLQCLMQDKKPLGFLLGAGCPASIRNETGDPLIPDINGITRLVFEQVSSTSQKSLMEKIRKLLFEEKNTEPTIEDFLTYLRNLTNFPQGARILKTSNSKLLDLERMVCTEIRICVDKQLPNISSSFHKMANWIGSITRDFAIEVFTTNYDLLIEQALEDLRIPFFDGFVGSRSPFFDPYSVDFDLLPTRWARVWKIHGSINWRREYSEKTSRIWRTVSDEGEEVIIHPSHLKYDQSRRMPYLALIDHLRKFLGTASSVLVIVGYSFRDQHLNDVIIQALEGSPSSAAFALMYSNLNDYPIAKSLAMKRGNLSILSLDSAVIGTKPSPWEFSETKPDSNFPTDAITWNQNDDGMYWNASFNLGDFDKFAEFLHEISGRHQPGDNS